ncbi:MAG: hypothetical protein JWM74_1154 [Myxococcaceae bacterium]|nr:hypothetical protein [Myxococcaceae bacterium]
MERPASFTLACISKIMQDPNVPDSGLAGAGMTQTGAVMGTPLYMAPEQARGKTSLIGPGTDVWAIGLIAVHLLVGQGQIYWRAVNIGELMVQIIAEPLYPPSSRWAFLPPSFDAWFMRSLARDPNERFKSVGEQVAHLAAALGLPHLAPGLASSGGSASNPQAPQAPASTPMLTTQPSPLGAATGTGSALARSVSGVGMQAGKRSPVMAFVALGVVTLAVVATASWFGVGYFKSHRSAAASSIDAPRATDSAPSTATIPSAAIAMPAASSAPSVASTPSAASVATASVAAAHTSKVPPPATHASATTAHTAVTATTSTKPPAGKKGQDFDAP